ncbi:MAG: methyltransferase domain-containing protein [Phycisphaerales bacterium]
MSNGPHVSILIPNFNNGRESSHDGSVDLLGDLLESLRLTLQDDPVPFEIIVRDDGSTDDSLATARDWAGRLWPDGRTFLKLHEQPHCGILSITANQLTREAQGNILVRLDGDITCLTPSWVSKIARAFAEGPPRLGVIGPKQLGVDSRIHAAGDWILHPRGNHHIAQGAARSAITRSIEVDHVMGCFYCYRREVWEDVGGFDETYLRGQTVDFGMMARLKGWTTFAIPNVEFMHRHALRKARATGADTDEGVKRSLQRFQDKWGFSRIAPDLDVVRERYKATPLLWNARIFGPAAGDEAEHVQAAQPATIEQSEWSRFARDEAFQHATRLRLSMVGLARGLREVRDVLHISCGAGLYCHLMAKEGMQCVGVDRNQNLIRLAKQVAKQDHASLSMRFTHQPDRKKLPVESGAFDLVLLADVIERDRNPAGLLREVHRVLRNDGLVAIISRQRQSIFEGEDEGVHWFRVHELDLLLRGTGCFAAMNVAARIPGSEGLICYFGRRTAGPPAVVAATDQSNRPALASV